MSDDKGVCIHGHSPGWCPVGCSKSLSDTIDTEALGDALFGAERDGGDAGDE